MRSTPAILDPWLPWLRRHGGSTEQVLGPWLSLVARAVGRVAERREPDPCGEPTGWSGLTRRGPYERLAIGEWLLAEELPDEFLRRATSGEHLFVELDRHRPHRAPWTVLLCDAGPEQLGAPRLVQLALLVVLATRRSGPERFAVGVLQDDALWEPALAPETGRAIMEARTRRPPSAQDATRWLRSLEDAGEERPELWVVGGRSARRLPLGRVHRVEVTEDWRTRALDVAVRRASGTLASVVLQPPPQSASRVMADPFSERQAPTEGDIEHLSATYTDSRWLFLRMRRDGVDRLLALIGPKRPGQRGRLAMKRPRANARLVGAARHSRHVVSLWAEGDELVMDGGRLSSLRLPRPARFVLWPDAPLAPMLIDGHTMVVPDADGVVWALHLLGGDGERLGRRDGLLWFAHGGMMWSERSGSVRRWWAHRRLEIPCELTLVTPMVRGEGLGRDPTGRLHRYRVPHKGWGFFPLHTLDWLDHWAWIPHHSGAGIVVGVVGDRLLTYRVAGPDQPPEHRATEDLGHAPIVWAGPDPNGQSYTVVTTEQVRFYSPTTLALQGGAEL